MTQKYWVTFVKYAGVAVEAESEEEAKRKAEDVTEEQYIFLDGFDDWVVGDAEELLEEEE